MVKQNKSVLITGGLGNLGAWLTQYFCERNYAVTVLTKRKRNLNFILDYKTILCDIVNINEIRDKIHPEDYDIVLHAASVNDGFVTNYFRDALLTNTLGTRNIIEVFKDTFDGHFIYFSTFQVYGKYEGIITEETVLHPKNDYGNTHLFSELYLKQFGNTHNFPYTTVRLTNSYGCPKDINSSKWYLILNDLSRAAYKEKKIILKSNGKVVRDFIWMQEVCEMIEKLSNLQPTQDVFNISGGKTFAMIAIANFVKNAYKRKFEENIAITLNENDHTQPSDLLVNSSKIRDLLSYNKHEDRFEEEAINIFEFLENTD